MKHLKKYEDYHPGLTDFAYDNIMKERGFKSDKEKYSQQIFFDKFPGLKEASEEYVPFEIIDYITDPGYGYDAVKLFFIEFENGKLGLCVYDTEKQEFVEEPGELEEYEITEEELYKKYGLKK